MLMTDFELFKKALKGHYFTAVSLEICKEGNWFEVIVSNRLYSG